MREMLKLYTILGVGAGTALGLSIWISVNRIGPRIMWSSDLCPDPNITCGVMPIGVVLSAFVGAIVVVGLLGVVGFETPDGETA